jgi:cephalosporin-C deacetylase-like acetyl esterase
MEHREDISNAVSFLAAQPEVDPGRVGGWGISMGGGHMLFLAAWEPRFRAVVAVSAEPKRLVVLSNLHITTYAGGRRQEQAAREAIAWFKQYL